MPYWLCEVERCCALKGLHNNNQILLLNCSLESMNLFKVNICFDPVFARLKFLVNYAFPIPLHPYKMSFQVWSSWFCLNEIIDLFLHCFTLEKTRHISLPVTMRYRHLCFQIAFRILFIPFLKKIVRDAHFSNSILFKWLERKNKLNQSYNQIKL